jgi:hypothetical protein
MVIRNSYGAVILLKCIIPKEFLLILFRMGSLSDFLERLTASFAILARPEPPRRDADEAPERFASSFEGVQRCAE